MATFIEKIAVGIEVATGLRVYYDSPETLNVKADNAPMPCVLIPTITNSGLADVNGEKRERYTLSVMFCNTTELDFDGRDNEAILYDLSLIARKWLVYLERNIYARKVGDVSVERLYATEDAILTAYVLNITLEEVYGVGGCCCVPTDPYEELVTKYVELKDKYNELYELYKECIKMGQCCDELTARMNEVEQSIESLRADLTAAAGVGTENTEKIAEQGATIETQGTTIEGHTTTLAEHTKKIADVQEDVNENKISIPQVASGVSFSTALNSVLFTANVDNTISIQGGFIVYINGKEYKFTGSSKKLDATGGTRVFWYVDTTDYDNLPKNSSGFVEWDKTECIKTIVNPASYKLDSITRNGFILCSYYNGGLVYTGLFGANQASVMSFKKEEMAIPVNTYFVDSVNKNSNNIRVEGDKVIFSHIGLHLIFKTIQYSLNGTLDYEFQANSKDRQTYLYLDTTKLTKGTISWTDTPDLFGTTTYMSEYRNTNYLIVAVWKYGRLLPCGLLADIITRYQAAESSFGANAYKNNAVFAGALPKYNKKQRLTFIHTSDIHGDVKRTIRAFDYMNRNTAVMGMFATGDIVTNSFLDDYSFFTEQCNRTDKFVAPLIGNHDVGNTTTIANCGNHEQVYEKYIAPLVTKSGIVAENKNYWYKDFADQKIRVIAIYEYDGDLQVSPSDTSSYKAYRSARALSKAQLDWLCNTLNNTPSNYQVLMLTHGLPSDTTSSLTFDENWKSIGYTYASASNMQGDCLLKILQAWMDGTAINETFNYTSLYSYMGSVAVNFDFSKRGNGVLIGWLFGHSHEDAAGSWSGFPSQKWVNITCTSGDSIQTQFDDLPRIDDTSSQDAFNVVSINTEEKIMLITRIGSDINKAYTDRKFISIKY